jgi:hypothetical protein
MAQVTTNPKDRTLLAVIGDEVGSESLANHTVVTD